jgi:UDP-N-acetylmuramoylalanine--D-glutamate ligase
MKRIVVIGGAESGSGAAVLARKQGFDVFLTDNAPIPQRYRKLLEDNMIAFEEGQHSLELILNADEVIKSPGVPDKAPLIQTIKAKGIPVVSEIEFAGRYTKAKMICITGSNGKTTTTLLTYHILKNGGLNVGLAGNIGQSFALQVAQQDYDYYVIELSSFQLDYMFKFKADVAVMLNITPDHLDRYHYNLQEYVDSKFRIIQNQTEQDAFIYWNDDPIIQREIKKRTIRAKTYPFSLKKDAGIKAFIEDKILVINTPDQQFEMEQEALALRGTHNLYNTMASAISANIAHIRKEEIRTALSKWASNVLVVVLP